MAKDKPKWKQQVLCERPEYKKAKPEPYALPGPRYRVVHVPCGTVLGTIATLYATLESAAADFRNGDGERDAPKCLKCERVYGPNVLVGDLIFRRESDAR